MSLRFSENTVPIAAVSTRRLHCQIWRFHAHYGLSSNHLLCGRAWCRRPERSPAPGWKGQKAPVGHLHRPALFAPWRVMWRPVFPGCHTHSGGFAIHAGRCSCTLGADNGNRTHLRGLGSRCSADELYPRMPCRSRTGAPLRERRACTYGPRLEGRR